MVEKLLVTQKTLKFSGKYSLKDLHTTIRSTLLKKGYSLASHQHELVHKNGRNQKISYLFEKQLIEHQKSLLRIEVDSKNITSAFVLDGDKQREIEQGDLVLTFTGRLHSIKEGFIGYRLFESFYNQVIMRLFSTAPSESADLVSDIMQVYDDIYLILHNLEYEPYTVRTGSSNLHSKADMDASKKFSAGEGK
jgi:hypothetical protein